MSQWDTSKMETNYDMLQKPQTYDMLVRMFRRPSRGIRCGARALRPSSPKLFSLRSTCVTLWLTRRASARACTVGTTHMAKWTADPWAFHCSCAARHCQLAVRHVWHKHAQGKIGTRAHSCQILMSPSLCDKAVSETGGCRR